MPKKCIILRISSLCIIWLLPKANTCLLDALVWCNKLLIFGLLNAKFGLPMASLKSIDWIYSKVEILSQIMILIQLTSLHINKFVYVECY